MRLKVPPVLVAIVAVILMVALSSLLPQFTYALPYRAVVAVVIGFVGLAIAGAGVATFRRLQTTVNPFRPGTTSSLAVEGIYRRSRNPMYVGVLFCLIACGIYLANVLALLLGPASFVIYMNRFQIKSEEQALAQLFGDDFAQYKVRVRRWL